MKHVLKTVLLLTLFTLLIAGCSGSPEPKQDPYNDADSQRSRADRTQGELSSETTRK